MTSSARRVFNWYHCWAPGFWSISIEEWLVWSSGLFQAGNKLICYSLCSFGGYTSSFVFHNLEETSGNTVVTTWGVEYVPKFAIILRRATALLLSHFNFAFTHPSWVPRLLLPVHKSLSESATCNITSKEFSHILRSLLYLLFWWYHQGLIGMPSIFMMVLQNCRTAYNCTSEGFFS